MKDFQSMSEREILALAVSLEEEDERVYSDFAEGLRQDFPASASVFDGMRAEEAAHRRRLIELYRAKFGEHMDTPAFSAGIQVLVGGALVFLTGVLIGSS
jgi:erythrin-vacuolar iron transport family protein